MGDLERAPHANGLSRLGTLAWSAVLAGSVLAIGVGFAGGRRYGAEALRPPPPPPRALPPIAMRPRELPRSLHGGASFDPGDDDPDPYGDPDRAVATRSPGWAPRRFDERHQRPQVGILVVDGDRAASLVAPFAAEPYPLAIVVAPDVTNDTLSVVRQGGKSALVACDGAALDAIAALRRAGAAGIACSIGDPDHARALVAADRGGVVLDDRLADGALYRAARAARLRAVTRDVVVDARDQDAYVDFLFAQAIAIARRTGVATVAVHARPASRRGLERFAARAAADGIDLVDPVSLAR